MEPVRVLGIDAGMTGGAAVVDTVAHRKVKLVAAIDIPIVGLDSHKRLHGRPFREFIRLHRPKLAVIERIQLIPPFDASAGGAFMRLFGALEATCDAEGVEVFMVETNTWKKRLGLSGKEAGRSAERQSVELAAGIFKSDAETFSLVKHHNRAEAALIAAVGGDPIMSSLLKPLPG